MVSRLIEKRKCRRFEIPEATVRYRRLGLPFSLNRFSESYRLIDLSKGGMAFECDKKLVPGMKIAVQLLVPGNPPLNLHAIVGRYGYNAEEMTAIAGIGFLPFGMRRGGNSREALEVLTMLDEEYGKDEKIDQFNPVRDHLF
jgi:hypothetical protein